MLIRKILHWEKNYLLYNLRDTKITLISKY